MLVVSLVHHDYVTHEEAAVFKLDYVSYCSPVMLRSDVHAHEASSLLSIRLGCELQELHVKHAAKLRSELAHVLHVPYVWVANSLLELF